MDALKKQVSLAHKAMKDQEGAERAELAKNAKAKRNQDRLLAEARRAEARKKAESAARKAARERELLALQEEGVNVLERWLGEFQGKNIYVHVTGRCRPTPAEVVLTVGLPDSHNPDHHCFFRQEIRVRATRSLRDVGVIFLPDRRFSSPKALEEYLLGEFLAILAKPIARLARDVVGDFTVGVWTGRTGR